MKTNQMCLLVVYHVAGETPKIPSMEHVFGGRIVMMGETKKLQNCHLIYGWKIRGVVFGGGWNIWKMEKLKEHCTRFRGKEKWTKFAMFVFT